MSNFDMVFNNTGNVPVQMDLETGSTPVPKLSTEGGMFTLKLDKVAHNKPTKTIEVVIIGQYNKGNETQRAYYEGDYVPGSTDRPACTSDNGIAPRADSATPQSDKCATCPQNQAAKGQRRKCAFYTTLAVALPGGDQPFQLRVPATSIFGAKEEDEDFFSLNSYKAWFAIRGAQPFHAVTKLEFMRGAQKGFSFIPVRPTTPEELELIKEAVGSPTYGLILRDQALLTAGKTAHSSEEPRDEVRTITAKAAPADDEVPFETTPKAESPSRGKSLADALNALDDDENT